MRLARGLRHLDLPDAGCVATIGNFDGVHLGHRVVIENLAREGHRLGLPVVVVLFEPQPREYFAPAEALPRLTRLREKLVQLATLPVDRVLLLRFDRDLANMAADAFIRRILIDALRVRWLVVGDDFRFGRERSGDFAMLARVGAEAGFTVADTKSVLIGGERVSSTLIRDALASGELDKAEALLGRPYALCGRVGRGARLGRELGFPTANLRVGRDKLPLQGVFAVTMTGIADRPLAGVANVGVRPTVEGTAAVLLETHLFDFTGDLYGRRVEVRFHRKLRDERRFSDVRALTEQIARDTEAARAFFTTHPSYLLAPGPYPWTTKPR
jgi:riboflavin kinase/FMN adenylyltransferase